MNGVVFNHQDKARAFMNALKGTLREYDGRNTRPNFVLMDNDVFRRGKLNSLHRAGCAHFFVYPHDAGPNLTNDEYPVWEHTTACLVTTEEHRRIMGRYGYPRPVHVIGWHLCSLKPFQATDGKKVLFAPIHPRCDAVDQKENKKTFNILKKLAIDGNIELTVRYIDTLEGSGLSLVEHENIHYIKGKLEPAVFHIDHADIVVGHLTFAYLGVARGVPTIFFGQDNPHHQVPPDQPPMYARNWNAYKDLLEYPYDIGKTKDPLGMLREVSQNEQLVTPWRHRMIGAPFDPDAFKAIIAQYIPRFAYSLDGMGDAKMRLFTLRYGKDARTWPKKF